MTRVQAPELSFSTVVPREHVHRSAISEVYLTDILCERYPRFRLGIQLPRQHSYYSDHVATGAASYDPLLLLECCRQASILIAHRYVGAEMDEKFVFNTATLCITEPAGLVVRDYPGYGILDAAITAEKQRGDRVVGITLAIDIQLDDRTVATMRMAIQWMPGGAWDKIRTRGRAALDLSADPPHALAHRAAPEFVARGDRENVVVGSVHTQSTALTTEIVVDQRHPSLFDHPLDHIPGAVIFEAMRQTGLLSAYELFGLSPGRLSTVMISADFQQFGEPELATYATATPLGVPGDRG
ncbi:AfsA-related hotdog domain-containing protein [Nocardia australiensis]|uniref:AfsA-related hotdog domain-containing protein n=1 Tax=Nocardia australiensis TaxID=2887191 RepID=UPI001D148CD5|nr:AfsA-related hotdog domain-containing protein [Nocardia australiensis]